MQKQPNFGMCMYALCAVYYVRRGLNVCAISINNTNNNNNKINWVNKHSMANESTDWYKRLIQAIWWILADVSLLDRNWDLHCIGRSFSLIEHAYTQAHAHTLWPQLRRVQKERGRTIDSMNCTPYRNPNNINWPQSKQISYLTKDKHCEQAIRDIECTMGIRESFNRFLYTQRAYRYHYFLYRKPYCDA